MSRSVLALLGLVTLAGVAGGTVWAATRRPPVLPPPSRPGRKEARGGGVHPLHRDRLERTALLLADSVEGALYSWGGGRADKGWPQGWAGVHGGVGWDCGGLTLAAAALFLRRRWDAPDLSAAGIAGICREVDLGKQQPGDVAVYRNRHITFVLTWPDAAGHSKVLSASGGGRNTNGDDPRARVRVQDRGDYRSDFVTYMRLPPVEVSTEQAVTCMAVHRLLAGEAVPEDSRLPSEALGRELAHRYAGLEAVSRWLETSGALRSGPVSGQGLVWNGNGTQRATFPLKGA